MLHFPSKLPSTQSNGVPRRSDSLNATQQRSSSSHPIFLRVEEELHDARRVQADGQEDDLRSALSMVINRVTELSSLLSEAYRVQADLEVQLNVAKSNLQLVIANNEMLEDALKRDSSIQSKDVGWRRSSARESRESVDSKKENPRASLERSQSVDYSPVPSTAVPDASPPPSAGTTASTSSQDNRFFKFRFSGSSSTTNSRPASRPDTPTTSPLIPGAQPQGQAHHPLTSPSMPSLTSSNAHAKLKSKEINDLTAELEKERTAKKLIAQQKAALEDELESLSQALFEEANKMVADERKARAETEEELKELRLEKEALRSALRLIDGENAHLRESGSGSSSTQVSPSPQHREPAATISSSQPTSRSHSRSSSQIGIKSRPESLDLSLTYPPLPPSPAPDASSYDSDAFLHNNRHSHPHAHAPDSGTTPITINVNPPTSLPLSPGSGFTSPEEDSQPTPRFRLANMPLGGGGGSSSGGTPQDELFASSSAWADVPSRS